MFENFSLKDLLSVTLTLFAIIDIVGSIPVIIATRQQVGEIKALKASVVAGTIMIIFLFTGEQFLSLMGIDLPSFAVAGSIVIFFIALEMVLGVRLFRGDTTGSSASVVPIAFPLIAGAGTMTTLLSLKSQFNDAVIVIGVCINMVIVYLVLRSCVWIEKVLGPSGVVVVRKTFGVVLLAIAIKLFRSNMFKF
ncbi:MAG: MarC family protein [Bacteroidia bacterium]|nr:MarC family protein [Bacteroidia bacterium]MDW8302230.1 MarC family protein [Bacteroidia bacterium]